MSTDAKKGASFKGDQEKNLLLAEILEQRFSSNLKDGRLMPLGISKSTSAIAGFLVSPRQEDKTEIEGTFPAERAQVKLSYMLDKDANVESNVQFDPFDREVHDAIVSLYSSGLKTFTTTMVFAVLAGKSSAKRAKPNPPQLAKIDKSIEKCIMSRISITFDINADEEEAFKDLVSSPREKGRVRIQQHLLNLVKGEFFIGGATANAYQFNSPPALWEYARSRSMIHLMPSRLVALPISMTETCIAARGVLSQRILEDYALNRSFCLVSFSDIDSEYMNLYKQKRKRLRDIVSQILDFWITEGFIKGYQFTTAGGANIIQIVIELNQKYSAVEFINLKNSIT